jgi:excisionase family DNA binding protein
MTSANSEPAGSAPGMPQAAAKQASTTDEITAVIGQLSAERDAALQASTTQPCMRLALAILRAGPDLAAAVRAGQLDLTTARRTLLAHQHPADNPLGITYLTAAEVSVLLRVSRSAVYRLLADERLLAVRAGPRSVRIPEPSVCGYLTGQAIAAIGQLGKPASAAPSANVPRDARAPLPQP